MALGAGGALLAAGAALCGVYVFSSGGGPGVPSAEASAVQIDPAVQTSLIAAVDAYLDTDIVAVVGGQEKTITYRELGVRIDDRALARTAQRVNGGEDPLAAARAARAVPVLLDREAGLAALGGLKDRLDRAPREARLDLEARIVHKEQSGFHVDVAASIPRIEAAARSGADSVQLVGVPTTPETTVADLGIDDISTVLGTFSTKFAVNDKERNYNLKLAASKLNGYVLQPGVPFSFNDVVGARTEKEGYKIAHVITAGEMVDGLAGGTCQISTTLHGAAFFSGVGITRSLPHSRPSTYVTMGLDATVVYDQVDLHLVNNYDFPVVIHYKVARGDSVVEILGRERPYDKIVFTREIDEEIPFETVTREDPEMPVGSMRIDQFGFPGYKLKRFRKYIKNGKVVKTDKWDLRYKPVVEYARVGINPDPNIMPPPPLKEHRLKAPGKATYSLEQ